MRFEKAGVVRRVEEVPGRRPVMRNNLSHDSVAEGSFIRLLSQSDMNVVVGTTEQVALHALTIAFVQRIVVINIRMSRVENETDERDRLAFAKFLPVAERNDLRQPGATWRRLTLGNGRRVGAGIAQVAERLQSYGCNVRHRRAEVILHCILLVVGGALALVTSRIAAQKIDSLWFMSEGLE